MAGKTTNYSIPYPTSTDPINIAGDMQSLAEQVDSQVKVVENKIPTVTQYGTATTYGALTSGIIIPKNS